jgi:hypothetical protein
MVGVAGHVRNLVSDLEGHVWGDRKGRVDAWARDHLLRVGAFLIHPPWNQVLHGAVPSLPKHDSVHYWFIAVSILGASISPYLFFFYSSGALEDEWRETHVESIE